MDEHKDMEACVRAAEAELERAKYEVDAEDASDTSGDRAAAEAYWRWFDRKEDRR